MVGAPEEPPPPSRNTRRARNARRGRACRSGRHFHKNNNTIVCCCSTVAYRCGLSPVLCERCASRGGDFGNLRCRPAVSTLLYPFFCYWPGYFVVYSVLVLLVLEPDKMECLNFF